MNKILHSSVRRCLCLLSIALWLPTFLSAAPDNGGRSLSFRLVDKANGLPVADADIRWAGGQAVSSDESGFFRMADTVITGDLTISAIGYATLTIPMDSATRMRDRVLHMQRTAGSLDGVIIQAHSGKSIFRAISGLDIHLRPVNNSQEVLRIVPGLFIGQHAGGGKSEQIFLRGFDIDHGTDIAITVDGLPVNMVSHAHGQGYADLHWVIPELIEKAAFNKGPYFADKGNLATAGYVDFRTRSILERNFLKTEAGRFNTFRGVGAVNLLPNQVQKKDHHLYLAGEVSTTRGYFDSPQDFRRYNGMLKYSGRVSPSTIVTATLTAFSSSWLASGQVPERAVESGRIGFYGAIDNTEGGATARYNAILQLSTRLTNGGNLRQTAYYTRNLFELYSNFTFFREDPVNGDQIRQKERRHLAGYDAMYGKDFRAFGMNMRTELGAQFRYDAVNDLELSRTKGRSTVTRQIASGAVRESNAGLFWSQIIHPNSRLTVTPGLRADQFVNHYADALTDSARTATVLLLSPKLNVNYTLRGPTQVYFYAGRGFHSNDTRVAVQRSGREVAPGAWGADLGLMSRPVARLYLHTALWYLWLDQEFVYVGDEGVVEPGGRTRRMGIDLSMRYELSEGLFADADLSFARPRAVDAPRGEDHLPLAPTFTSAGGLTYRRTTGLNGSLRYRYMADRPANESNTVVARGYCILDANLNYTRHRWEAGLSIQNLLDSRWKETQFDTESRLADETTPVSEIHFTPGTPFAAKVSLTVFF